MHHKRKEDHNAFKHGQATGNNRTALYRRFRGMFDRCNRTNATSYGRYGAKGIRCLWKDFLSFKNEMEPSFLEHVKIHGERNTTIDRIDCNGNYCKENCRWATYQEQGQNQSSNRLVTFRGDTACMSQMARKYGLRPFTLQGRLNNGWDIERALTQPLDPRGRWRLRQKA